MGTVRVAGVGYLRGWGEKSQLCQGPSSCPRARPFSPGASVSSAVNQEGDSQCWWPRKGGTCALGLEAVLRGGQW